jgi:hypothetical protein
MPEKMFIHAGGKMNRYDILLGKNKGLPAPKEKPVEKTPIKGPIRDLVDMEEIYSSNGRAIIREESQTRSGRRIIRTS